MENKNTRIEWIDIAKGIGIILVVIGHSGIPKILSIWIYSFHMPLFFLISGVLFDSSKYSTLYALVNKRFATLIGPYVIFSIFVFIWAKLLNYKLLHVVLSELYSGWIGIALWFIPVLFITEIIYYIIAKYLKSNIYIIAVILISACLGYYFYLNDLHFPFKIEAVLTAILYYGIGNITGKSLILFLNRTGISLLLLYAFLLFCLSFYFSSINIPVLDIAFNKLGNFIPTHAIAIIGVLFVLIYSALLSKVAEWPFLRIKFLISFLGTNSLVILSLHQVILLNLKMIFEKFDIHSYFNIGLRYTLLWSLLLLFIYSINNYTPWLLGKKIIKPSLAKGSAGTENPARR